jgi:hypothetical protein
LPVKDTDQPSAVYDVVSAPRKFSLISWPENSLSVVHYHVHRSLPWCLTLSLLNSVHTHTYSSN